MEAAFSMWSSMSVLQQAVIAGVGFLLVYWIAGAVVATAIGWLRIAAMIALLAAVLGITIRHAVPDAFCAIPWPVPISTLCA
jgi:hypothetical protein